MGVFNPDGSINKGSSKGLIDWNAANEQSSQRQKARYSTQQRQDKGFDFFKDGQKTTIEDYAGGNNQNVNDIRAYLYQQGDPQAKEILTKQYYESQPITKEFNQLDVFGQRQKIADLQGLANRTQFNSAEDIKNRDWAREQLAAIEAAGQKQGGNPLTLAQDIVGGVANTYSRVTTANARAIDDLITKAQSTEDAARQANLATMVSFRQKLLDKYSQGPTKGNITDRMTPEDKALFEGVTNRIATNSATSEAVRQQILEQTDPTKYAGAAAQVALDTATAGIGGKIVGGAISNASRVGNVGRALANPVGVGQGIASGAAIGAGYGAGATAEQLGTDATFQDYLVGAGLGAGIGAVTGGIGGIFSGKAASRLQKLKEAEAVRTTMPELSQGQFDAMTPQKVPVQGASTTEVIPVSTRMTDKEYATKFNSLSKSYDVATKKLEAKKGTMSEAAFQTLSNAVDDAHVQKLGQLDDAWLNPTKAKNTTAGTTSGITYKKANELISFEGAPDKTRVSEYKARLDNGGTLEPVIVIKDGKTGKYGIEDGKHRYEAYKQAGITDIPVIDATPTEFATKGVSKTKGTTPKAAGGAIRLEQQAIESDLASNIENVATFGSGSIKQESALAAQELATNPERIRSIAFGKTRGDNALHEEAAYAAVRNKAIQDGDSETIAQLAKSRLQNKLSESAQRLSARGYGYESHDPVELIRTLRDTRVQAITRRLKKTEGELMNTTKQQIEKAIKTPNKLDWDSFVQGLEC